MEFYDENDRHYIYVIVRKDMSLVHRAVQGGHALITHCSDTHVHKHPALVFLQVDDEADLIDLSLRFDEKNFFCTDFIENYGPLDQQLTAIALGPIKKGGTVTSILSRLEVMR